MVHKIAKKNTREDYFAPMSREECDIIQKDKRYLIAIACSTGGPKALQSVIPKLPKDLKAPILIVQHMPKGFTASLADRLNGLSRLNVTEAFDGEEIKAGHVYLSMGGVHLKVKAVDDRRHIIQYSDEPLREGVKPCANFMYESLMHSNYDEIICVVMTGMGQDATVGIRNLKQKKNVFVITQSQESSTVYGMPRNVVAAGLSDVTVSLDDIAQTIISKISK